MGICKVCIFVVFVEFYSNSPASLPGKEQEGDICANRESKTFCFSTTLLWLICLFVVLLWGMYFNCVLLYVFNACWIFFPLILLSSCTFFCIVYISKARYVFSLLCVFFLLVTSTCDDLNKMSYKLQFLFGYFSYLFCQLYFNHILIFCPVDAAAREADEVCQALGKCTSTYKSFMNGFVSSPSFVIMVPW